MKKASEVEISLELEKLLTLKNYSKYLVLSSSNGGQLIAGRTALGSGYSPTIVGL